MGYKRDGKKLLHDEATWKQWRKEYNDLITASGIPDLVISDEDHWYDFLDHGYLDHHKDELHFSVHQMTVLQKTFLLQLVGITGWGFNTILGQTLIADLVEAVKLRYRE